jgi:hypothetical protein
MHRPVQLFFEAITAVLLMATMGIISAFIAAAISDDRAIIFATACTIALTTEAILGVRLRQLTRTALVVEEDATSE